MGNKQIAVIGAGIIGRTHLDAIAETKGFAIAGIVEPASSGESSSNQYGCRLFPSLNELIADRPDGAIIATPNETHVEIAVGLLEAGIPVLVEKPLAVTVDDTRDVLAAVERLGVPAMTGHQRRYNPIVLKARELAKAQQFGHLVQGSVLCSLKKPESYFEAAWRHQPGVGGPLLINMIHEIDLLRFIFGEVQEVTAITSNRERGFAVEDTAGAILTFRNGGLVTLSISDAASAPWAWDISADENPGRFPAHAVQSHFFCGSDGAFSLPDLTLWSHPGEKSWTEAMRSEPVLVATENAYVNQIVHFGAVIDGKTEPRCSALDGARNVAIIDAIKRSSAIGGRLALDQSGLKAQGVYQIGDV